MSNKIKIRAGGVAMLGALVMWVSLAWAGDPPRADARSPLGSLGISGIECRCSFTKKPDSGEQFWLFKSEPKITRVDPEGPAAGKLREGDVIVAVDGFLITTRKAGVRFANVEPGEPVELTIRRDDRIITRTLEPTSRFQVGETTIRGLENTVESMRDEELSKAIESLASVSEQLAKVLGDSALPEAPGLPGYSVAPWLPNPPGLSYVPELPELPEIPRFEMLPSGRFGVGLSFSGRIRQEKGEPWEWSFNTPPQVSSVREGSPADKAGLKERDILTHIDGVRLDSKEGGEKFSAVQPGQKITWTIQRNDEQRTLVMVADARTAAEAPVMVVRRGDGVRELRFAGSLGKTDIEVHGNDSIKVTYDRERGEIVIQTRDGTIRLKAMEEND